jgi:hypothetical protein
MNDFLARIPQDPSRLAVMDARTTGMDARRILEILKQDSVVLIRDAAVEQAEVILGDVAAKLGLLESLELQASFADFLGHRRRIGKYQMSVNKREQHEFIPPHSEGDSFINLQLASFYCFENNTDGGETVVFNLSDSSRAWQLLREKVTRVAPGSRALSSSEWLRARGLYHLRNAVGLCPGDRILRERSCEIPGLRLVDVLALPVRSHSLILDTDRYVYWDSIASTDFDSWRAFERLLRQDGRIAEDAASDRLDNASSRRVWSSGVDHNVLFTCKLTLKLEPGDLLLQNNLTWAHAALGWSPNSGTRNMAAAFA